MPTTTDGHQVPALNVDAVVLHEGRVLLIRRGAPPFEGHWALPGGFVEHGEAVEDAARREAEEETGMAVILDRLLGVYSAPDRDPRHHTVSVVYMGRPEDPNAVPRADTDASDARWWPTDALPAPDELAFDHADILRDALDRAN